MRQQLPESGGGPTSTTSSDDGIAIIGMACRLPGSATSPEKLWEMLEAGRSAWTPEPPDGRFTMSQFYDPHVGKMGSLFTKGAHFLKQDIAMFDRKFFNISATEAAAMDPQIRLLLEIAYETFENAGVSMEKLVDSQTGVFVGSWSRDYHLHLERDPENAPMYESTGTAASIVSNRISHFFDLKGPSFTLDTACSSSLVALHQACLSLKNEDCETAFVGGVNLIVDPVATMALGRMRLLSPDGRSYSFDQRANGYGRGEGVGGILLKPLRAAQRDGDTIRAVIRSSALNQDGFTPGITMPSASSQEKAIRRAYSSAKLQPTVDYVECHGTGTAVGDPIETKAISAVLAQDRSKENPLVVGSVKSSIGHLEAAAGIASIIKSVLMLERGVIPPQALLQNPTTSIAWDDLKLKPSNDLSQCEKLNRISVNSFGFGGANAHVVVEKATGQSVRSSPKSHNIQHLAILTASSEDGCKNIASGLNRHLVEHPELQQSKTFCKDLAYTLSKRSMHKYRVSLTYSDVAELSTKLDQVQSATLAIEKFANAGRTAFVFTGQGAQWAGMAKELIISCPNFRATISRAADVFKSLGSTWDLVDELLKSETESNISNPLLSQPISTAVQVALVDLLVSVGLRPSAVIGHSSGELAAAYTAGVISFEDVLAGAYYRGLFVGEAIQEGNSKGQMLAVGLGADKTNEYIAQIPEEVGKCIVACHNSPSSVTVSGDEAAVMALHKVLQVEQIFSRPLKTNGAAYHSHHMHSVAPKLSEALKSVKVGTPRADVTWVSSVSACDQTDQSVDGEYWVTNLVSPVLFPQALEKVCKSNLGQTLVDNIIEIGPHSALAGPIKQTLKATGQVQSVRYMNVLTRGQNSMTTLLSMIGLATTRGCLSDLSATHKIFDSSSSQLLTNLPSYPWDHERFWHSSRIGTQYKQRAFPRHELLGVQSNDFNIQEPSWRNYVRLSELPWLKGHAVHDQVIWPGAGFIAMAVEAVRQLRGYANKNARYVLRDIVLSRALVIRENVEDVEINFKMRPQATSATDSSAIWNEFRVFTLAKNKEPQEHCRGLIALESEKLPVMSTPSADDIASLSAASTMQVDIADFYRTFRQQGMGWRNAFAGLTSIHAGTAGSMCTVKSWPTIDVSEEPVRGAIHPGTLDSMFQASFAPMIASNCPAANVITGIDQLEIKVNSNGTFEKDVQVRCASTDHGFEISTIDRDDLPFCVNMKGFHLTEVAGEQEESSALAQTCFGLHWEPMSEEAQRSVFGTDTSASGVNSVNGNGNSEPLTNGLATAIGQGLRVDLISEDPPPGLAARLRTTGKFDVKETSDWKPSQAAEGIQIILDVGEDSLLSALKKQQFDQIQELTKQATNILWISKEGTLDCKNPSASTVSGFAATLRVENPALKFVTLDVDAQSCASPNLAAIISQVLSGKHFELDTIIAEVDLDLCYRDGEWFVPRVLVNDALSDFLKGQNGAVEATDGLFFENDRPLRLATGQPGLLDTLRWEDQHNKDLVPKAEEVIFETRAHGVNFRDLLVAVGQLGSGKDAVMAGECSGVIKAVGSACTQDFKVGDRVSAFGAQPYANFARVPGHRCIKVPENVSLEVAASIPIVVSTVVYALLHVAQIEKGSKVLIHSATGGVGQAAVMLAHHVGAEVFATVGNAEKKRLLVEHFGVAENHVLSSRDSSFQQEVMKLTDGTGVDMVLNSLTGELFRESCNCLATFGHFVEIGKRDLIANSKMDMRFFLKNASFTAMDLMVIGKQKPRLCKQLLSQAMELISSGSIKPIRMITAPLSDVTAKFREMQKGVHVGKIVLTCDQQTMVKVLPRAKKSTELEPDASYLIIGGLGGLGRTMIRWMAARGAKHIVTMSRTASKSLHASSLIREMESQAVKLTVLEGDVSSSVTESLDSVSPPIKGVIQAAMVLQDSIFEQMGYDQWQAATLPKIQGTKNLHEYFSSKSLDFFVMLSSVVSVVGNAGQAAYGAANSYLDGLARHRNSLGLTGHSINVGVVSDAGVVSQNDDLARMLASRGYSTITVKDLLHVIDHCISNAQPTTSALSQTVMGIGTDARALKGPKFAKWLAIAGVDIASDSKAAGKFDLRLAGSVVEAQEIALGALAQQLAKLLSIDSAEIEGSQTLANYGIDSLTSVELRNWIRADLKAAIPLLELNESGRTINDVAKMVATRSSLVQ